MSLEYTFSRRGAKNPKNEVIAEMKGKLDQLGLSLDEVMGVYRGKGRKRGASKHISPKYVSPTGETWSGRGAKARWIRELEAEGRDIEEFRIDEK